MIRTIIKIDEEKCNGCALCVSACHEGAIGMVDGKAKLLRDDYCDGLGNCLPVCPTGAISFEEREAAAYDDDAVKANMAAKESMAARQEDELPCGCPGMHVRKFERQEPKEKQMPAAAPVRAQSQLSQWPVQIKLVPVNAPYFENAHLLVAADCSAYAYANFHERFIKNRIALIGCPKLDDEDYAQKLAAILKSNNIKSVTVVRMEVPCCGGIEYAVKTALRHSGKMIPWQVVTLSTDGRIIEE
ncbi:MAG: ATP-binding protein [Christensenellales bacterium]